MLRINDFYRFKKEPQIVATEPEMQPCNLYDCYGVYSLLVRTILFGTGPGYLIYAYNFL